MEPENLGTGKDCEAAFCPLPGSSWALQPRDGSSPGAFSSVTPSCLPLPVFCGSIRGLFPAPSSGSVPAPRSSPLKPAMTTVQAAGRGHGAGRSGLGRRRGAEDGEGPSAEVASLPGDLSPLSPPSWLVSQSSFTKPRQSLSLFCFTLQLAEEPSSGCHWPDRTRAERRRPWRPCKGL